jgi:predicted dienelactone hydrolase
VKENLDMRIIRRTSLLAAGSYLVLLAGHADLSAQEYADGYWLGENRGPFPTGTTETMWDDTSRGESGTSNPDDTRRMMVQMWYPATHEPGKEMAIYASTNELYQEWMHIALADNPTLSQRDADLPEGTDTFPVLIYNHGAGVQVFSATYQTEFLASNGYVVVSIGHAGYDGLARFPDGSEFKVDVQSAGLTREDRARMNAYEVNEWRRENAELQESFNTHVLDVTFALDQLERLNSDPQSRFYHRLDFTKVGAFGWSIGGATSLQAARDDERIKAVVNMDGELMGRPVEWLGSPRPLLFIQSKFSGGVAHGPVAPGAQQSLAEMNRRLWQMLGKTNDDWFRAVIEDTDHISFIDAYRIVEPPDAVPDIDHAQSIINQLVLEFFDKYLKGKISAPLLSGEVGVNGLVLSRKPEEGSL